MSIKLDDIMKVIIFFETMHCLSEINKKNIISNEIVETKQCATCEKSCKRINVLKDGTSNFYLGYILLNNQSEEYYKLPQEKLYIQDIYLVREENELVYKLMLPNIGVIPDNKIIFTNNIDKYAPVPEVIENLDYYSLYNKIFYGKYDSSNLVKLTLFNHNNYCGNLCICKHSYTLILKEIGANKFCIKYMWKN